MPLKGADKHRRRLARLSGPEVTRVCGAVVYEGADTIRAYAYQKIGAGSVQGKGHVVSAPGDFPNREFGDLQNGLEARQTGALTAEVVSKAPHAKPLEFGTSRMEARPYMRPSRDAKEKEIRDRFASQMNKLVKRSG